MSDAPTRPVVFISYSHDSDAHRERVLGLSERLRKDGFDTRLDRYVNGTPSEGWPRWMMDGLDEAVFVLVVCTETYYRRFRGHEEPGIGKGVDWEGALITQAIYKARSDTDKFVPVMFDAADSKHVPEPIGSHTHYVLDSEQRYADLCDFLDGVAGVEPGVVRTRERKQRPRGKAATFGSGSSSGSSDRDIASSRILRHAPEKLFGRERWLDELDGMWEQRDSKHVFTLVAWGGVGKTSLVAHWVQQRLAARNWPGVERYFDWSFYSQGTGESRQTSSDFFISEALEFFGDDNPTDGGPWQRGERLARLVRQHRTLLVLDGIEPLQYPEGDPSGQGGMLKDQGLTALLQGLAADNPGLCVVTTREALANLKSGHDTTAPEQKLDELQCEAAQALLRYLGIDGSDDDLEAAWQETGGHALTLQLLGTYLAEAHGGDIRKRDVIDLQEADRETQGRSAFKVMAAYERWLSEPTASELGSESRQDFRNQAPAESLGDFRYPVQTGKDVPVTGLASGHHQARSDVAGADVPGSERARPAAGAVGSPRLRMLAILRLTGLFDRPIAPDCLAALRADPPIPGLTDALAGVTDAQWNTSLKRLETLGLIALTSSSPPLPTSLSPHLQSLDAHPLIREYFADQLRSQHAESFQAAHGRLFDHLCETTDHRPDGLDGLQPLYQAVVHGCLAGRHEEARKKVYVDRILRGTGSGGNYSTFKLGAIGSDLSAVAAFFDPPWSRVSPNLSEPAQAWLLNEAAFSLRALGRLTEALEPMRVGMDRRVELDDWKNAAASASNQSELEVTLGRLESAVADARRGIDFADRSGDAFLREVLRTTAADALHQSGDRDEARDLFAAAERMQQAQSPQFDLLYSLQGFRYCDLLLAPAERAAWRAWLARRAGSYRPISHGDDLARSGSAGERLARPVGTGPTPLTDAERTTALDACTEAERRATQTLEWISQTDWLLDIALDNLTLSRATLYASLLPSDAAVLHSSPCTIPSSLPAAVHGLRTAGTMNHLPKGLLTAAVWHAWCGERSLAVEALNEALQIALQGPMPLYQADTLLTRARLFGFAPLPTAGADDKTASADVGSVPIGRSEEATTPAGGDRPYPWDTSPEEDLKEARLLIEKHGYGQRFPELEDAEAAFGITPKPDK